MNRNLKDAKILIVDDEQANIEILEELLNFDGYSNYRSLSDSRQVLDTIDSYKPDLLLLDLMMPHIDGFQIMEKLMVNGKIDGFMPIMVLTADATMETKQRALSAGASDFLTKPFDLIEVGLRIKNLLYTVYLLLQQRNYNAILEERLKERTSELKLLNTELIIAKEKAEESNKLKSFFLANVSHEFRTPLISILGFSEILKTDLPDIDHANYAKLINDAGLRLERTLQDLLYMTEIENKRIKATLTKTDLIQFITEVSKEYKRRVENSGLKFELKYDEPLMSLFTDTEILKYLMDNILENSIKYTEKGTVKIELIKEASHNQSAAIIKISDTGIGIESDKLKTILLPFRQGSEGLSRRYDGMGIGLTVSKQFVDILNGNIDISSVPGTGTDVFIKLPITDTDAEIKAKVDNLKKEFKEQVSANTSGKPNLLLVEDNYSTRVLFNKILKDDFVVDEAEDGLSALAKTEINLYDIILMDINLGPGIDGIETFIEIKKSDKYKEVPVIAVTAFGGSEDKSKFINYGFADYIQKPVMKKEFIQFIIKSIKKAKKE